jgi:hypothetical protein
MVEAGNRSLKYYGLYKQEIAIFTVLQKILPVIQYDHLHKPLHTLMGLHHMKNYITYLTQQNQPTHQ